MNILKYVDVLIALALVMVLLSPLVTAITQMIMWLARSRPSALRAGLRDLLLELSGDGAPAFGRAIVQGPPTAVGKPIALEGFPPATFDSAARAVLDVAVQGSDLPSTLTLKTIPNIDVSVTLERHGPTATEVASELTDGAGKTTLAYTSNNLGHESRRASISVLKDSVTPVDATIGVAVTVDGNTITTPSLTTKATAPAIFDYPGTPPRAYALALVLTDANGPLKDHCAKAVFERNSTHDIVLANNKPTGATGTLSLTVPPQPASVLTIECAWQIAGAVLLHPMIATPGVKYLTSLGKKCYMGHVVEREELIRILLELAASEGPAAGLLSDSQRQTLSRVLARNGVPFPGRTLAAIRQRAQELERAQPTEAAHLRQTKAIIDCARCDFVGKINNWFDQAMSRVAARYTLWARSVTVLGALVVALVMRVDSLELLRRLSVDDALRTALVEEAKTQESRIEKLRQAANATGAANTSTANDAKAADSASTGTGKPAADGTAASPDEQQTARNDLAQARTEMAAIQSSLSALRSPELAIVPDRFFWQPRQRARLTFYEPWKAPFPQSFDLILGTATYTIKPAQWRGDPIDVLRTAIEKSGAPVDVDVERAADQSLTVKWAGAMPLFGPNDNRLLHRVNPVVTYTLAASALPVIIDPESEQVWQLVLHNGSQRKTTLLSFTPCSQGKVLATLAAAIQASKDTGVDLLEPVMAPSAAQETARQASTQTCTSKPESRAPDNTPRIRLAAQQRDVDWIAILSRRDDDNAAIDGETGIRTSRAHILKSHIVAHATGSNEPLMFDGKPMCGGRLCADLDLVKFARDFRSANDKTMTINSSSVDRLVLTSQRLGTVELRPTGSQANLLGDFEQINQWWPLPEGQSWRGLMLTWILLSLGAPFWYDLFKDLLKLRPALAQAEEQQRRDRHTQTPATDTAKKQSGR